ncbi:hypothetical protein CHELA1G11_13526 [Hyphomicrobiales bacterium]|nr:hypothetical protein CHELA1G2_10790 [Hyphomicrobiales bacterium]CAH1672293.1 hypothetical protein CHELA1G11_13526 [Hyphomicrobiales bacterium]
MRTTATSMPSIEVPLMTPIAVTTSVSPNSGPPISVLQPINHHRACNRSQGRANHAPSAPPSSASGVAQATRLANGNQRYSHFPSGGTCTGAPNLSIILQTTQRVPPLGQAGPRAFATRAAWGPKSAMPFGP